MVKEGRIPCHVVLDHHSWSVLIMMGHSSSAALLYYFRLEDQVPGSHLLRLIEKKISFTFVREKLKDV
jgi:hypothetical protein